MDGASRGRFGLGLIVRAGLVWQSGSSAPVSAVAPAGGVRKWSDAFVYSFT